MGRGGPALPRFRFPLALVEPWRRHAAPWLIGSALVLNVLGVVLPFMELRRGLAHHVYSLPRSVGMLWDSGLYVLAVVVVAFSVVFPFVKLAILGAIVLGRLRGARAQAQLAFVARFGKWSMLDVFLVCLMLALANDQLLVGATPMVGILCFTSSIVLSMFASSRMQATLASGPAQLPALPASHERRHRLLLGQGCLLVLVVAVVLVPFLEIDDWLFSDHPVSIAIAIAGLWQTGAEVLAIVIALFLVAAPLAAGVLMLYTLKSWRNGVDAPRARRWRAELEHWAMLDVFALALGIFLVEGRSFVKTELSWGAFLLALLLVVYWAAAALYERRAGATSPPA